MMTKKYTNFNNRLFVEIDMDPELRWDADCKFYTGFFTVWVKRGRKPTVDTAIDAIFVGYQKYEPTDSSVPMTTCSPGGNFDFEAQLNPQFKKIKITVIVAGKSYQRFFNIPPAPQPKPEPKAGWLEVKIGDPANDGLVKGRMIIRESKDGPLAKDEVRISSNRPFLFAPVRVNTNNKQQTEFIAKTNGEMLFQIQMSRNERHQQQQIFFVLLETGQEIKKLIVKRNFLDNLKDRRK